MPRKLSKLGVNKINIKRSVFLFDFFDSEPAQKVVEALLRLDAESNEPITIFINSYGGALTDLYAIIDTIDVIKSPVITFASGAAYSCGAYLLSCGEQRYVTENTDTMFHEVQTITYGSLTKNEEELAKSRVINDKLLTLFAENTGKTFDEISLLAKNDYYMSSKQALSFGLVDGIVTQAEYDKLFVSEFSNVANKEADFKAPLGFFSSTKSQFAKLENLSKAENEELNKLKAENETLKAQIQKNELLTAEKEKAEFENLLATKTAELCKLGYSKDDEKITAFKNSALALTTAEQKKDFIKAFSLEKKTLDPVTKDVLGSKEKAEIVYKNYCANIG